MQWYFFPHQHIRKTRCAQNVCLKRKLYSRREKHDILKSCFNVATEKLCGWLITAKCAVLPPLDCRPCALAAATCLAGALGAREELCDKLRDVRKLRVGAQHVHGLLDLLKTQHDNCKSCGLGEVLLKIKAGSQNIFKKLEYLLIYWLSSYRYMKDINIL